MNLKFHYTVILLILPFLVNSQVMINSMQKIMIRNVVVIDPSSDSEDVAVSILIENKKLQLVTTDKISLDKSDIAFDAKEGFILGKLVVGNLATLVILNTDPRINSNVILDTKPYVVFAITDGEVVVNKLFQINDDNQKPIKTWRSYSPPPVALPLSYQNSRKWNVFRSKPINLVLVGAILIDNTRWLSQDDNNKEQVGELSQFEGGSVRGLRAGLGGTFNFKKPWTYVFSFGTRAFERGFDQSELNEFVLYDYRVDIPFGLATLSIGKQKETVSLSRLSGMIFEPAQQERASVIDGLLTARNVGIVINRSFFNNRMTGAVGIFNNWYEAGRSFSNNPTIFTGRVSALPLISEDESNLLHLGISGRYSNAAAGIRYQARTEIYNGPGSVDTELIEDASSTFLYGLELAWRKGPFILTTEYVQTNVQSSMYNNPSFKGYNVVASYIITGEMRNYNKRSGLFNRVRTANAVSSGGWGTWEVFGRWSAFDLTDNAIMGGEMNTLSTGLNWWPSSAIQTSINYRYSILDRLEKSGSNHGMVMRLALLLE